MVQSSFSAGVLLQVGFAGVCMVVLWDCDGCSWQSCPQGSPVPLRWARERPRALPGARALPGTGSGAGQGHGSARCPLPAAGTGTARPGWPGSSGAALAPRPCPAQAGLEASREHVLLPWLPERFCSCSLHTQHGSCARTVDIKVDNINGIYI